MFDTGLETIFKEIYYLSRYAGFTPQYIERMTPIERMLYWRYFEEDEAEKREKQKEAQTGTKRYDAMSSHIPAPQ